MISKTIHYCWFGRNPLPPLGLKCLESWKKYLPDYQIIEWNEDNFDVNSIPYTKEAAEKGKWAFVSDYARFYILYHYGGIYVDTDVEILKPLDTFLNHNMFTGFETIDRVAPGLILGAVEKSALIKELMDSYTNRRFINSDGSINDETVVSYTTNLLVNKGLKLNGEFQTIVGLAIYPTRYFSPKSLVDGKLVITEDTHSIHHYAGSWMSYKARLKRYIYLVIASNNYIFKLYSKYFK